MKTAFASSPVWDDAIQLGALRRLDALSGVELPLRSLPEFHRSGQRNLIFGRQQ